MSFFLKLKLLFLVRIHLSLDHMGHCYNLVQSLWGKTSSQFLVLQYLTCNFISLPTVFQDEKRQLASRSVWAFYMHIHVTCFSAKYISGWPLQWRQGHMEDGRDGEEHKSSEFFLRGQGRVWAWSNLKHKKLHWLLVQVGNKGRGCKSTKGSILHVLPNFVILFLKGNFLT